RFGSERYTRCGFAIDWDTTRYPAGQTSIVAYARTPARDWGAVVVPLVVAENRGITASPAFAVDVVGVTTPASPGSEVQIVGKTQPWANCVVMVVSPLGPVACPGLEPTDADANGQVRWSFTLPPDAVPGEWQVAIVATVGQQIATAK